MSIQTHAMSSVDDGISGKFVDIGKKISVLSAAAKREVQAGSQLRQVQDCELSIQRFQKNVQQHRKM